MHGVTLERPLRLAFVGQSTFFEACVLAPRVDPRLEPRFFEFRQAGDADALMPGLRAFDPDVVIVFRPEIIPAGAFADLRGATLGFLTEPLPRTGSAGGVSHEDLERRLWALLLLNKLGVLSIGVKIVGAAAGWVQKLLGKGWVALSGTTAAAEMRAAFASGGAAAAAAIRAAMGTGGATAGTEIAAAEGPAGRLPNRRS